MREQEQRRARAAADVRDTRAGLEPRAQAGHAADHGGHQEGPQPRREAALDPARALGPEGVVGQADAARKESRRRSAVPSVFGSCENMPAPNAGWRFLGQHRATFGREREALGRLHLEQAGGGLVVEPLAHPALVEPAALRQLRAVRRAALRQCAIQAQLVAQVHERGGHGAVQMTEQPAREVAQAVRIDAGSDAVVHDAQREPAGLAPRRSGASSS